MQPNYEIKKSDVKSKSIATYSKFSQVLKHKNFYLMLLPLVAFYLVFCYAPMYGVILSFKTFDYSKGILGSPWIGVQNFKDIVNDFQFLSAVKNTLIISLGKLIFNFPLPIILAILMNELSKRKIMRLYQTVFTLPHFISWVVISGVVINIFGGSGVFNQILNALGMESSSPLIQTNTFRPMLYITNAWKEMGWDSIIYLAALAGINPELYESAEMDGANRFQRIIHITWPGIRSTVSVLLILAVGNIMGSGSLDQVLNLYSAPVYSVADIIDTYIYRVTFTVGADYGYMTAIGLSKSLINLVLLYSANMLSKKLGEGGLF
ncbi:MAG: protein lplB [Eubacterium sp.]|nr:protein lplB [Eubacterium sp.]